MIGLINLLAVIPLLVITANTPAVNVKVDPQEAPVATNRTIHVSVKLISGAKVKFPKTLNLPKGVLLSSFQRNPTQNQTDGAIISSADYIIKSFSLSILIIPAIELVHRSADGSDSLIKSEPVVIKTIATTKSANSFPEDLRKLETLPIRIEKLWPLFAIIAVIIVIVAAIVYWQIQRSKREKPPTPPLPSHEIAIMRLRELKETSPMTPKEEREWFFSISIILREYMENRYFFNALELTTFELRKSFNKESQQIRNNLFNLLETCDQVKFANRKPSRSLSDKTVDASIDWVTVTKENTQVSGSSK